MRKMKGAVCMWKSKASELALKGNSPADIRDIINKEYNLTLNYHNVRNYLRVHMQPDIKAGIEYIDKRPTPTANDVTEYWEKLKELNQSIDNMDTKQTKTTIRISGSKPIGICHWGDWHLGSQGITYESFERDKRDLLSVDGAYFIGMGDYKENQKPTLIASGTHEQIATTDLQDKLVMQFMTELKDKALALVRGCHDDWDKRVNNYDFVAHLCSKNVADCVNLWHGGEINIKLCNEEYKINARHKSAGNSQLNTTNAQRRLLDEKGIADVFAVAHLHYPDLHQTNRHGRDVTYVRSGSYKKYDEYGQKLNGYSGKEGVPLLVYLPDRHEVIPFKNLQRGLEYLSIIRSRF
jgi:hypothetical protein